MHEDDVKIGRDKSSRTEATLSAPEAGAAYRTPSSSLGGCVLETLDDVADALAVAELPEGLRAGRSPGGELPG
jgi:hypothetical protein